MNAAAVGGPLDAKDSGDATLDKLSQSNDALDPLKSEEGASFRLGTDRQTDRQEPTHTPTFFHTPILISRPCAESAELKVLKVCESAAAQQYTRSYSL